VEAANYSRVVDFESMSLREDVIRRQGNYPPRGGGAGFPIQGEQRQISLVSGAYAWNLQGDDVVPMPQLSERRQLEFVLLPHGFIKAAMAASPTAITRVENGKNVTVVSFKALGKYPVNGTINDQNLITRILTWIPDPAFGDMIYTNRFGDYKDFGGVKFPTVIHQHTGEAMLNLGRNSMEIYVNDVKTNVGSAAVAVPESVKQAKVSAVRVETERLADGVWKLGGGSHHSLLVEFRDFVTIIEAPLNEKRSLAVIAEAGKLVPNKPIRYVVNTHHHLDHSGGLRTYAAWGATVITHEANRDFYERVMFAPWPRTLQADRYSLYPREAYMEPVHSKYVVSDGTRTLDLYQVASPHADGMLIAHLPKEKILVTADLWSPLAPGRQPPTATPGAIAVYNAIKRQGLAVDRIVGIHGGIDPLTHFESVVGPVAATYRGGGE
jgi:glyoxylase-like metal-dependent hydrolase (beta-lactamase superfamily II)